MTTLLSWIYYSYSCIFPYFLAYFWNSLKMGELLAYLGIVFLGIFFICVIGFVLSLLTVVYIPVKETHYGRKNSKCNSCRTS